MVLMKLQKFDICAGSIILYNYISFTPVLYISVLPVLQEDYIQP